MICVLAAQGIAITQSYLWAAPLVCLLFMAVAVDLPLVSFIAVALLVRVLTDDLASKASRHSSSLNLSAFIAVMFILVAIGLLLRRRQGLWPALAIGLWLGLWTAIAASGHGVSTLTSREGVREASIVAVAMIAYNSRGILSLSAVTRLIQLAGIASAMLALYQLASHTGLHVAGKVRAYGTFDQPNDAAVFFAVATMVSLWRYVYDGRRRLDALFGFIYLAAIIATFSLGGLASLLVMLVMFGLLRPGSLRIKLSGCAAACLVIIIFLATPLGAERVAQESSSKLNSTHIHATANTSLAWRFLKWQTLIPQWEQSPLFGQGLGTTVTAEGISENGTAENLPHSEYVRYLVETGVIGLITLVWGVLILISRMARTRALPGAKNGGMLGIAIVVGLLVNAVAANTLLYTTSAYATALIVGAVLSSLTVAGPTPASRQVRG